MTWLIITEYVSKMTIGYLPFVVNNLDKFISIIQCQELVFFFGLTIFLMIVL
jgi:hypothetical protein